MFEELSKDSFPEREKKILTYWEENNIFQRSIEQREDQKAPYYSFYDGPPFATGLPHYGHLLAGTLKDVVPRYKAMKGYIVPRRFGWDCHGLPVEHEVEKQEGLSGAKDIEAYGISEFNEACRSIVLRYSKEWKTTVKCMGRWVDFSKTYRTMDPTFMESIWWVFKELFEKGYVYEGFKVVPYSAKLGTGLSNNEVGENYKDVQDPSLVVKFPVEGMEKTYLLAWTTTPWTLISNLALAVSPDVEYIKIQVGGEFFILAKPLVAKHFDKENYKVVESFRGKKLIGIPYKPLFDYFTYKKDEGAFKVLGGEFVSTEDGTGIVHLSPAFGEDDFFVCKDAGIELVCPVDTNGRFTEEIPEHKGLFVKDADKAIIRRLKDQGSLHSASTIQHRYPFCWRSDTPLIYKAIRSWYVAVEKIKDRLVELNEEIHWTPEHIKQHRFGNWLRGARDWCVSRTRYWGTPMPIWRSEDGEVLVIGSVQELEELSGKKVSDLHKHFIDQIHIRKEGKTFTRIPEVFDCWFESGSMPYAQNHYPFENKDFVASTFPADFIAEGIDQTRGWFYTLTVLSGILFDKPAFKNVIVNGIILAEDGMKMSKRLKNYPEPSIVIDKYGADALRLYMLQSPAVKADDLRFSEKGVELVLRQVMIPWWNAYSFFVTYANIYQLKPDQNWKGPKNLMDRWILSKLQELIAQVEQGMDHYELARAVGPFVTFIDQLTNWYIRTNRRRFYEDQKTEDIESAFQTLYHVLLTLSQVAAPFAPFITDEIYQNLKSNGMPDSVHLCDFPAYQDKWREHTLEEAIDCVQRAVSLGHFLRKQEKVKVRQPLPGVQVICSDENLLKDLKEHSAILAEELNVKEIFFSSDNQGLVLKKAKPNFRVLGKKVGKLMRAAQSAIEAFTEEEIHHFEKESSLKIDLEGRSITLTSEDIEIELMVKEGHVAANDGNITILLDTVLSEELIVEGIAREIRNKVSAMRREDGLKVTDRIHLKIDANEEVSAAIEKYKSFLQEELLAPSIEICKLEEGIEWDINSYPTRIALSKMNSY